jgi:uncharacterized protein YecT (DUF1311 family)
MTRTAIALIALSIAVAGAAVAAEQTPWNWGADKDSDEASFAKSKAICRKLGAPIIPAADRPSPAEAARLKGCDAEALYYGQGMARDYVKARQCAILQADHGNEDNFFSGKAILMQVYANGLGVARNLPLATSLACAIESAPAENDARVIHLQALMAAPANARRFDICDDITSGFAGGECSARDSAATGADRDQKIASVAARFPASSRPAFADLKKALDAFTKAHGEGEVDESGTARDSFIIHAKDMERDQFLQDLTRLADGKWPKADHTQAAAMDAKLNLDYKAALACVAGKTNLSTVKVEDVRTAQRAWLAYRDAYVRFGAKAAPTVTADAITARMTKLRTLQLEKLPCN